MELLTQLPQRLGTELMASCNPSPAGSLLDKPHVSLDSATCLALPNSAFPTETQFDINTDKSASYSLTQPGQYIPIDTD